MVAAGMSERSRTAGEAAPSFPAPHVRIMAVAGRSVAFQVARLIGHSDVKMTEIYAHLQPETMHDVVDRLVR